MDELDRQDTVLEFGQSQVSPDMHYLTIGADVPVVAERETGRARVALTTAELDKLAAALAAYRGTSPLVGRISAAEVTIVPGDIGNLTF